VNLGHPPSQALKRYTPISATRLSRLWRVLSQSILIIQSFSTITITRTPIGALWTTNPGLQVVHQGDRGRGHQTRRHLCER